MILYYSYSRLTGGCKNIDEEDGTSELRGQSTIKINMVVKNHGLHKVSVFNYAIKANLNQTSIYFESSTVKVSEIEAPVKVAMLLLEKGVMIWLGIITTNPGDDFDPAYILLLTGCDCFFSSKIQTFKLFSFLICLPLHINLICKYCTFESYVWIVLYRLRLASKKQVKRGKKRRQKPENQKRAMLYCICIHF